MGLGKMRRDKLTERLAIGTGSVSSVPSCTPLPYGASPCNSTQCEVAGRDAIIVSWVSPTAAPPLATDYVYLDAESNPTSSSLYCNDTVFSSYYQSSTPPCVAATCATQTIGQDCDLEIAITEGVTVYV